MKRNAQYWTQAEHVAITQAQSFAQLVPSALVVLERMPKPVAQVCGPISTGGQGSLEKNLAIFDATIDHLLRQDVSVFDQMPFEEHFFRIMDNKWGTRANNMLLEDFYRPILESGHVSRLYFIHGWESSEGANWEHALGQLQGMEIVYLERDVVLV